MKTLITGGTGFVGKRLVEFLLDAGESVVVPSRDVSRARASLPERPALEVVPWDGRAPLELSQIDRVVHLAGEPAVGKRYTDDVKRAIMQSRVETGRALVQSMARAQSGRPKWLISASGVGFYGPRPSAEVCAESDPPGHDFLARVCVEWEKTVREAEPLGVHVTSLRFGVVLGRAGGALPVMARPFRAFVGGPLGDGTQMFPWVHIEDAIAAICFVSEHEALKGPLNLVAPEPVSNEEFSHALGRALHRPSSLRAPAFALRALFGEGADPLLTGQRVLPTRLEAAGFTFRYPKLDDALRDCLGPER